MLPFNMTTVSSCLRTLRPTSCGSNANMDRPCWPTAPSMRSWSSDWTATRSPCLVPSKVGWFFDVLDLRRWSKLCTSCLVRTSRRHLEDLPMTEEATDAVGEAACAYELFMIDDGEPIKYEDVVSGSAVLRQNDLVPENALVLAENELLADGENTIMKYDKPAGWKLILVILAMLVKPVETTDPLGRDGQCWKDDGPEDGSEFTELYWFLLLILVSWIIIDYMLKPHTRLCCWRSDWMPCRMPCRPASAMWLSSRVVRSLEEI